jgi:dTMP kinase
VDGLFLTFEGPEGAGKSTQVRLLAESLRSDGFAVCQTREPGGTPVGERIRDLLLGKVAVVMAPETEALLHTAARAQHVRDVIRPALERGVIVLCDRFVDSTLAYQGGGGGVPFDELANIQRIALGDTQPDMRFLLDLPVETGLKRRREDGAGINRVDELEIAFHNRVRNAYHAVVLALPVGWRVIDANGAAEEIAADIRQEVARLIVGKGDLVARQSEVAAV